MIDWDRTNSLRHDVGADDFDEVIDLFFEEVDSIVARLKTAPDPDTLEEDLHALKGCALGLGFRAFAKLCQTAETLCNDGKADEVNLTAVLRVYADSRRIFLEGLPNALAG